jgi:hypothetical protein
LIVIGFLPVDMSLEYRERFSAPLMDPDNALLFGHFKDAGRKVNEKPCEHHEKNGPRSLPRAVKNVVILRSAATKDPASLTGSFAFGSG